MQDSTATTTKAPAATPVRKRPKLDFTSLTGGERKRGKSMFGVLVNTLNKAKAEDKERNASEAVSKNNQSGSHAHGGQIDTVIIIGKKKTTYRSKVTE